MLKVTFVSQNVQSFKKITEKNARKSAVNFALFWLCWHHKYQEKPTFSCEHTQITETHTTSAHGDKNYREPP